MYHTEIKGKYINFSKDQFHRKTNKNGTQIQKGMAQTQTDMDMVMLR